MPCEPKPLALDPSRLDGLSAAFAKVEGAA